MTLSGTLGQIDDSGAPHKCRVRRGSWFFAARGRYVLAVVVLGLVAPDHAVAAPFCVVVAGLPDECLYVDATDCGKRAARLHGRCGLNPAAPPLPHEGGEAFCEVQSSAMLSCLFPDAAHCAEQSARDGAACVEAPVDTPAPAPRTSDPFQQIRPYGR